MSQNGHPARSRILVTGAAGFIGSHLCDRLLERGHAVWGLDNFDPYYAPSLKRDNLKQASSRSGMHMVEGDIRDSVLLTGLFADVGFDTVVHLAARPGVRASIDNPEMCFDVNLRGTLSLIEAMARHDTRNLVFASSSSVYGEADAAPFTEGRPADRPISPYAASKRSAEMLCHTFHHLQDFSVHCLRLFTVYGPRQRPDLAIRKFAERMLRGETIPVFGDGGSVRDYTYVDDIVDGLLGSIASLESAPAPAYDILNLGSERPVRLSDLIAELERALGVEAAIERLPEQAGDVPLTHASTDRAREILGYEPRTSLREGLERFADWLTSLPGEKRLRAVGG